jgi:hypothetical protein
MRYELEEPSFEEKGRIMNQKEIDGNRSQVVYSSEGKLKGSIEVTNTRDFIIVSKGNNVTSAQGQGVITTKDDSGKANYAFLAVGKLPRKVNQYSWAPRCGAQTLEVGWHF